MTNINFSIVIPLYNKEFSIKNTILSVLNQSYQNFEIVIVDDGSTDGSVDVVKTIQDDRVFLIHQENRGVSAARNRGIKETNNECIAFLDGDDLWKTNHLEEIVKMMSVFPNEKIYVTSFEYSDNRSVFKKPRSKMISKIDNYFDEAVFENIITSSNVIVKKSALDKVGLFNENLKYGEDLDMWFRLALKFDIVKNTNVTAIYRVDAENRSDHKQNLYKCFEYYIDLKNTHNNSEKKYLRFLINRRLYSYIRVGEIKFFFYLIVKHGNTHFIDYLLKKINKKIFK